MTSTGEGRLIHTIPDGTLGKDIAISPVEGPVGGTSADAIVGYNRAREVARRTVIEGLHYPYKRMRLL